MVLEAQEQPRARPGHHHGVAIAGRMRFREGSDEPESLRVPSLAGGDVSDGEAEVLETRKLRRGLDWRGGFGDGGHGVPP